MPHNMTVTIEDPLWNDMKKHSEIRWSAVMKDAASEKLRALKILEKFASKTKLSEKEIRDISIKLGRELKGQ